MKHHPNIMQWLRTFLSLIRGSAPGQLIIQQSDFCNANCPQCELRVSTKFKRSKIPLDDIKRIIDTAAQRGIQALSITGGEPFLHQKEVFHILEYAHQAGIRYTRTGTNGFLFMNRERPGWESRIHRFAESLKKTGLYTLWVSIDSANPKVHETMRGLPGVIQGIEKAIPILQEYGIYPSANLGINRNIGGWHQPRREQCSEEEHLRSLYGQFRRDFAAFYRFVIAMGFTIANACYPMSVQSSGNESLEAIYAASSDSPVVRFTYGEKAALFQALLETIPGAQSARKLTHLPVRN